MTKERKHSILAPDWWDYTTLEDEILEEAAKLSINDMKNLERKGFKVVMYNTIEEFYVAEALEYITSWKSATRDDPVGVCGPIGPTEQLPLVARLVNELGIDLKYAHFWAMDEWVLNGREVPEDHPLSFAKADRELCFDLIKPSLRMPKENMHFPKADLTEYIESWEGVNCKIMQGGQGEIKHWAFNDPLPRKGVYENRPPTPEEYLELDTRIVDLHPVTIMQNARTSGGGLVTGVPTQAITVGPVQTWRTNKVSLWHAGIHDNPFGMRLTTLMIGKKICDSSVPMSLLSKHPNVQFNFYKPAIGTCEAEMH